MGELGQIDVGKDTNANVLQSSGSIQQTRVDSTLGDSQSKIGDIFNKSISEKVASVVGDVTKGFFKEFFGVKFKEGAIPEEDISSKEGGVPEGNNVSERVTAKKVLKGIVGTFLALPFLIGMGPLYIANMIRFAAKKEEDIYAYELNKLLQSGNANDKKQAIYFLEKILANGKSTVEYNAAKNFLSKDIRPLYTCLGSTDDKLKNGTKKLLTNMLKNEDPDIKAVADKIVRDCLASGNRTLKANTIALLAEMLKDENTGEYEVAKTLLNKNDKLIDKIQDGLSKMLDNEDTKGNAIKILKNAFEGATKDEEDFFENKILHKKGFLVKNLDDLEVIEKDSSIELLLKKMFDKSETKDLSIKVLKYLDSKNLYSDELRKYFSEKNKNGDVEVLDQEEVLDKD